MKRNKITVIKTSKKKHMVIGISRKKIGFNIVVVSEGIRKSKKQKKFSKLL